MQVFKAANLALSFLLELCALFVFGYWGYTIGQSEFAKIALGIVGAAVFIAVWALFMAPRSPRRLQEPARFVVELLIFGLAVAALYSTGQTLWASLLGAVYAINKILQIVWKQ